MSWTSVSRALGRSSPSKLATGCAVPSRALFPPQRTLRPATTVSKPRAKKTPFANAIDDATAAAKKNLSTQAPPPAGAVPAPAKSPRKKKTAEPAAAPGPSSPAGALNGSARNTSTRSIPFAPKKVETKRPAVEAKPVAPAAAKTAAATPARPVKPAPPPQMGSAATWPTVAKTAPPKAVQPPPPPPPPKVAQSQSPPKAAQLEPPLPPKAAQPPPPPPAPPRPSAPLPPAAQAVRDARLLKAKPVDVKSTPEYKRAARKWVMAVIGLPLLLVTSYLLFDRCEYAMYGPANRTRLLT